jgi:outer membrane protein assembly complex protein YaeT
MAPPPPGAPYSVPVANIYIRQVYDLLRQNGYRFASIWSEFDETLDRVVIQVDPGPLTIIGKINVSGNNFVDVQEILSRLAFAEGDPWNEQLLSTSKRNLLKTGLFSRVVMKPGDGEIDDSLEDMIVEIVERPLRSLVVGTGANSLFGLHLFGEYTDKQLFADGRKLTIRSDLYVDGLIDNSERDISQGIASLIHTNPSLFASSTSLVSDLRFQKLTTLTQEFDVERIATTNLLNFSLSDRVTASLGHTLSFDNIVSVPDDVRLSSLDSGNVRLGFLSGSTTLDLRDSPLNPTKGITSSVNYKVSLPGLLSQASFYTVGARATALAPLTSELTLAGASRWGWADTFGNTTAVPITQRYYLGGRASVRGFRENSLGPLGEQGNIIGGELLQNNSVELQYRLYPELQIHTFFDSGSMALQSEKSDFWTFRSSAGIGSRYLSPIGPIGFDVGFPLDERDGEPSVRFHFNIGSQF